MKHATALRLVATLGELRNPGDYAWIKINGFETVGRKAVPKLRDLLYMACPSCNSILNLSGHTIVQKFPLTIRRSLLCGCRFHAWITNGEVEEIVSDAHSKPPEERV